VDLGAEFHLGKARPEPSTALAVLWNDGDPAVMSGATPAVAPIPAWYRRHRVHGHQNPIADV
jgi:hypothetical protein